MRAALQSGITGLMTFLKLLEIIFPHLAHLCREEMPTLTEEQIKKDGEDGGSMPLMEPQQRDPRHILFYRQTPHRYCLF